MNTSSTLLTPIRNWFGCKGWTPLPFQEQTWKAHLGGRSGLIQVPTGSGKTYAATMAPIARMLDSNLKDNSAQGIQLLYITPLRALSRDLALAIEEPIATMQWSLRVGIRNGDTSTIERNHQIKSPPHILITTPESLCVLLAGRHAERLFQGLKTVILDEWHELLGSKRGTQTELAVSWLRQQNPRVQTWAISATIGNLQTASFHAHGHHTGQDPPVLITSEINRSLEITSILPDPIDGFPWGGHLGLRRYEDLVAKLAPGISTLLFTNTRNQAERWYQCLRYACPEMDGLLALHHSSLDRQEREAIEARVKSGDLQWVVCTSSLDLGVDFQPVERVVQIGSPKNLARLLQRAGRSAHLPAGQSQMVFMPTNALELLELSAVRRGLNEGLVEERRPPLMPLDVLLQHLTTLACGPGFSPQQVFETVRSTETYKGLSESDWNWCLQFLEQGGTCLGAYERYRKLEAEEDGRLVVKQSAIARLHRLNIGTISSNNAIRVRFIRGEVIGQVEEMFISQLKPKDVFCFAGRQLEFVRLREMTAYVKTSQRKSNTVPAWSGGQMALSDLLTQHLRDEVARAHNGDLDSPELKALEPLLQRQKDLSTLPTTDQLLIETCHTREGSHLYVYPFEGRFVHEGLGFLFATRLTRCEKGTITVSVNDYGFELLAPSKYPFAELMKKRMEELLCVQHLEEDLEQALNLSELCKRRFRSIAQIAGLLVTGYPGQKKNTGQLQISGSLLFDVFSRHEPTNRLLSQARNEVLNEQLELPRLKAALDRMGKAEIIHSATPRPTPLAFPLLVERLNSRMSNESLLERIKRMQRAAMRLED